jgi:hypothetical protein
MAEMVDILWRQQLLLSSRFIVKLLCIKAARVHFLCSTNSLTRPRNDTRVVTNVTVKDNSYKRDEYKRRNTEEEWKNRDDWMKLRGVEKNCAFYFINELELYDDTVIGF